MEQKTLVEKGRRQTLQLFISVVLLSAYVIVVYNILLPTTTQKLASQIMRFCLTIVLMYWVMKGKKWAVVVSIVLFALAAFMGLLALTAVQNLYGAIPLLVMVFIYSKGVYHLGFSKSFKAYLESLQS